MQPTVFLPLCYRKKHRTDLLLALFLDLFLLFAVDFEAITKWQ